jgi:hypothetical protein
MTVLDAISGWYADQIDTFTWWGVLTIQSFVILAAWAAAGTALHNRELRRAATRNHQRYTRKENRP